MSYTRMISPVQSHYHEGSPMSKEENLRWKDLLKRWVWSSYLIELSTQIRKDNSRATEFIYYSRLTMWVCNRFWLTFSICVLLWAYACFSLEIAF